MSRKLEIIIGYVGAGLTLVFLGSFAVMTNMLNHHDYQTMIYPTFKHYLTGISDQDGLELFKSLGSWFGFTLVAVLILVAIANLLLRHYTRVKLAGVLYLVAGLVTLFGSQMLAFPIAFVFFVDSGLCFLRKERTALAGKN